MHHLVAGIGGRITMIVPWTYNVIRGTAEEIASELNDRELRGQETEVVCTTLKATGELAAVLVRCRPRNTTPLVSR
jgi:hypothetical protein